jgi:hypothetical protein
MVAIPVRIVEPKTPTLFFVCPLVSGIINCLVALGTFILVINDPAFHPETKVFAFILGACLVAVGVFEFVHVAKLDSLTPDKRRDAVRFVAIGECIAGVFSVAALVCGVIQLCNVKKLER